MRPSDRERLDAGTLTIDQIESEEGSPVRVINFDPLVLPNGITGSDEVECASDATCSAATT